MSEPSSAAPDDWDSRHRLAVEHHQSGDTDGAIALMLETIRSAPGEAVLHNTLAVLHHAAGHFGPAVAHYQEAIALNPDFAPPYDNILGALETGASPADLLTSYDAGLLDDRPADSKRVLVASHERSGTHMLINTLALNFRYSTLWVDVETSATPDGRRPTIAPFLDALPGDPFANVFKSHHAASLFAGHLEALATDTHIFYIHRDGRDVMTSFWRFAAGAGDIDEGPRTDSVGAFMTAVPSGRPLLYQPGVPADMLDRWVEHVGGWLDLAQEHPGRVTMIRFEDLLDNFDATLDEIAEALDSEPAHHARPSLKLPSVAPWRGASGTWREHLDDSALALYERRSKRLGQRLAEFAG